MRKPRFEYQGAYYHVIARGNHRQKVFLDIGDRVRYLKYLGETLREREFKLYAYCLMGNHIHLLIKQCSEWPLSRVMHRLQTAYTQFFNTKHHTSGHLFQGRYKSILVDSDAYLLQLIRYIHLNPWRAKMEEKIGKYPWSSHGQYVRKDKKPSAPVESDEVLKQFSKIKPVARKRYQQYVLEGSGEGHREELYTLRSGRILGGEEFEALVYQESGSGLKASPRITKTIDQVWAALKNREGMVHEPTGWAKSRLIGETAYWMVEYAGRKQTEVAVHFKIEPTTVHEALKRQKTVWIKHPEEKASKESWLRNL
jgi:putative transposase